MSSSLPRSFITSMYGIVAVCYLIGMGWSKISFERPQMPPAFARWVDGAVPSIIEKINENKGDDVCALAVFHFSGDPTGYVSEAIRLETAQNVYVTDKSILEKVYEWLNLPHDAKPEILTKERAVELGNYAKTVKAQAVIWGSVMRMSNKKNVVDAEIRYYLIGLDGSIVYENVCNNESLEKSNVKDVTVTAIDKFKGIDWRTRLLLWALGVITLPLITINFLIATTAKRSNKANAFALFIYTLIDGIALFLMIPPNFKDMEFYSILFFVCMILLAGVCNLFIMDFARKLKE